MNTVVRYMIRFYQKGISPFLGSRCRFHPTCSQYALESFESFGFFRAVAKSLGRLLRCHPFHPGGWDPVVPQSQGESASQRKV